VNLFAIYNEDGSRNAQTCNLFVIKLSGMIAIQVGSFTLHGVTGEDTEAAGNARMVEVQQHRWEMEFVWNDTKGGGFLMVLVALLF
jgi:hypothetical protein